MTVQEKMSAIIEYHNAKSLEDFIYCYLDLYGDTVSTYRLVDLINVLNQQVAHRVSGLETVKSVANERAYYIKTYIEGNMYTTQEEAIRCLPVQIKNAEAILEVCKRNSQEIY